MAQGEVVKSTGHTNNHTFGKLLEIQFFCMKGGVWRQTFIAEMITACIHKYHKAN